MQIKAGNERVRSALRPQVARYFFHTNHPAERILQDDEGMVFSNVQKAKAEAVVYAGRLLSDAAEHFWNNADFELIVTDAKGLILFTLRVVGTEAPAVRLANRSAGVRARPELRQPMGSVTGNGR
jgi:hypothetical protein